MTLKARLASLGLFRGGGRAFLNAPAIDGFQPAGAWREGDNLDVGRKGSGYHEGFLLRLTAEQDGVQ